MKALSFVNWLVLSLAVIAAVLGAAVALLRWPFPRIADGHGLGFVDLLMGTGIAVAVALAAALATWLLEKRHRLMWAGQGLLLVAVIAGLIIGMVLS